MKITERIKIMAWKKAALKALTQIKRRVAEIVAVIEKGKIPDKELAKRADKIKEFFQKAAASTINRIKTEKDKEKLKRAERELEECSFCATTMLVAVAHLNGDREIDRQKLLENLHKVEKIVAETIDEIKRDPKVLFY